MLFLNNRLFLIYLLDAEIYRYLYIFLLPPSLVK